MPKLSITAVRAAARDFFDLSNINVISSAYGLILFDLSKAFDTLDHAILLHKLEAYGITEIAHKWITDYFSNKKQFVQVNGSKSCLVTRPVVYRKDLSKGLCNNYQEGGGGQ